jgi:nicotinamidase-related amidase
LRRVLLVVDMQAAYISDIRPKHFTYDVSSLISAVNERISQYNKQDVIYIMHLIKNNFINRLQPCKVFEGSEDAQIAKEINVVSDLVFTKYKGDAFSNDALDKKLKEMGVDKVEVVGIDGGGCAALTALGAIKHGYKVFYNTEAVGTMIKVLAGRLNKKLKEKGAVFI